MTYQLKNNPRDMRAESTPWNPVFVMGCPRSGTTWVQLLLNEHPEIATAPETQIFPFYLKRFQDQWRHEGNTRDQGEQGRAGLSRLLSETEFRDLCRQVALRVLTHIRERSSNPDAVRYVVEKSPQNAEVAQWIHELFPHGYFIHVIRDPRDTSDSLLRAALTWGSNWAPRNPIDAARMWTRHVENARSLSGMAAHYMEVRYEDLLDNPTTILASIFEWLGAPASHELCRDAVEACSVDRLRKAEASRVPLPGERSPTEFFGPARAGNWRASLPLRSVRLIEEVCRTAMLQVGYMPEYESRLSTRTRIRLHTALQRFREAIDWRFQRALFRI